MNSEYKVQVKTTYGSGRVTNEELWRSSVVAIVRDGHLTRCKEWIESMHPYIPGYVNPFKIVKIKFDKQTGNLTHVELREMR